MTPFLVELTGWKSLASKGRNRLTMLFNLVLTCSVACVLQNLFVNLTNLQGSTVAPPTTVQASIILRVGNHQPSFPRMKQLAQTIANSSSRNLGLNHRVFGRVKQISLSSYLSHSLHSGRGTDAPSPAPMPHQDAHHHLHHHHQSRNKKHVAPSLVPVHSPVRLSIGLHPLLVVHMDTLTSQRIKLL
jgi:hypothetical protein